VFRLSLTFDKYSPNGKFQILTLLFQERKATRFCVVIPVLNEGERIAGLLQRMSRLQIDGHADVIIVDGGSVDGSLSEEKLRGLGVTTLLLKTGKGGLSARLRCAYAYLLSRGYLGVITIDGNNKDDPEAIFRFSTALNDGVYFVQGSRFVDGGTVENTPLVRDIAIRWIHAPMLKYFSGFSWTDTTQGFRAYSRALMLDMDMALFRNIFDSYELLTYISLRAPQPGFNCREVPTKLHYPKGQVPTKISAFKGNLKVLRVLICACLADIMSGRFSKLQSDKW